jgi:hypothetical protein
MSENETKGYTIPRGIGGVEDAPRLPTQPGVGDATPTAQWVLDLLSNGVDTNKPLGDGFQSKYDEEITRFDSTTGEYVTKLTTIDAQEYLKSKGFNFIYYPYMAGEVARDIEPGIRIVLKNQLASVGLIDLTKTQGAMVDEEFTKGIRRLMEFSMNNGGKLDWVQSLGLLRTDMSVRKSAKTKAPVIENDQMDDIVDELLAKSKARKGAPLSQEEKDYITSKINNRIGFFNQEIQGLSAGTEGKLVFDPTTPVGARLTPGTPAQEADAEQFAEDLAGIEEEVFAPREEAARVAEETEATRARGAATIAGLTNLSRRGVQR